MFGKVVILLRTFSSIDGLPIIDRSSGREYGEVIDILMKKGTITGILVDQIGWLNRHLIFPLDSIYSFGEDGIMVDSTPRYTFFTKKMNGTLLLKNGKQRLRGVPLFSKEGMKLGLIDDVYFCENSGTIVGYEVTDGFVADLLEGRKIVRQAELVVGGGRAILTK